jgi:anti-sigma B factor antagonist
MELKINKIGDIVTIILEGRIDANVAPDIEHKILSLISEGAYELVADLSEVIFISSAGLRALITALKEAKRKKGDLRLAGVKGRVLEVFEITGFSTIFQIYGNVEESIQSFSD